MLIIVQHPPLKKLTKKKKKTQYQSPTRRVRLPDNLMLVI